VIEADRRALVAHCAGAFGTSLSEDDLRRLDRYLDLLDVWNPRLRLTGERDRSRLIRKHVADSLACVALVPEGGSLMDIGSGAGFPGGVVACVRPDADVTLLDARERPVSFLREAIRTVPLPRTRAVVARAEEAAADPALAGRQDVVTSRAIRFDVFARIGRPFVRPGGRLVAMQTPATNRAAADTVARSVGLTVLDLRDYRLPDGEARRLVVLG
jgi:16S rRNA (guanine527-N7)-methyltransferase